jgi:magnesium transporter
MQSSNEELQHQTQNKLGEIQAALGSKTFQNVRRMLNGLEPADIAHLLESSPPTSRWMLWRLVDQESEGEVLQELAYDIQTQILERMNTDQVVGVTEGLDTDDIADILQQLPNRVIKEVLAAMSARDRQRVESVLAYDEDTAGGLMNTDIITVRARLTLDIVLRYLRRHDDLPPSTDNLIVINKKGLYVGLLPVSKILTSRPSTTVREVMLTDVDAIPITMPDNEVASLFERHDWISAPVIDTNHKVVGRITIDDVVDVIREDADHSLMSMAGLDEDEDTFAPVRRAMPRRATWLGVNLITAVLASLVISIFEDTINKVVALAVLMPIVASMGGVAGSQTLTVVIRGMALGQIGHNNIKWLLSRELIVGMLNGMLWALVLAAITSFWFGDYKIAIIIAFAMVINLVTAAAAGAILPVALKRMNIDPALAGSVALTTITDVVGFFAFLGLATYVYR